MLPCIYLILNTLVHSCQAHWLKEEVMVMVFGAGIVIIRPWIQATCLILIQAHVCLWPHLQLVTVCMTHSMAGSVWLCVCGVLDVMLYPSASLLAWHAGGLSARCTAQHRDKKQTKLDQNIEKEQNRIECNRTNWNSKLE